MRSLLYAANWKMHIGPAEAIRFADDFVRRTAPKLGREIWFFPPAVSLRPLAEALAGRGDIRVGAQDVHWEAQGAYTGALSVPLVAEAGATVALVGHSERRHVFGETDSDTGLKLRAILAGGLAPVLCVGETLAEREADRTDEVVRRQLAAGLEGVAGTDLARVVVAYEPVWAIGTGRTATPTDAAAVHRTIRADLKARGASGRMRILYGGSVKIGNVGQLLAEDELDGVLVGGASLTPDGWSDLVARGGPAS